MMLPYAPGSRVVIRDEEWLIRRADPAVDGGWLLSCDGVSELVQGQSPLFLTELEDDIEVLDPVKTQLIYDNSPTYNAASFTWKATAAAASLTTRESTWATAAS
jgi:hypothetical protein